MLFDMTVPQFIKMLHNLDLILDKGAQLATEKKFEVDVLLNSRLTPNQFNLIKQVQIACDTAKLCAARLSGKEAPTHNDSEKTLPELKTRIAETISFLKTITAADFKDAATKHISQPRWEGKYLTGEEYVIHHAVPNIYFHVTTAYSILRHNGVEVGKKDYLGELPFKK
ncbi:DUF1993 domain-containing protein [Peredibacter starrii]|uniref:DUF1993 domain-containing protein n=1 Tax=Peredibacter starrii TaxID=28202 RepID=A0AAX4HUL6_9BACT|nr:DUF1993 domain-containing protein [Peredibacter starrii]WPU66837.1 DUF1993 domain-containing protein [Peredibacter starrii]